MGAQTNPTLWFSGYAAMYILGFPSDIFSAHDNYWWVALAGPICGVIVSIIFLIFYPVMVWNEPNNWKKALKKALENKQE